METTNTKRGNDGRYAYSNFRCGHTLGVHLAGERGKGRTINGACINHEVGDGADCGCEKFRAVKAVRP